MTGILDVAGILWRAFAYRSELTTLSARARPFINPMVAAAHAVMAAHKADPGFLKDAMALYDEVVGIPLPGLGPPREVPTFSVQRIQESLNVLTNAGLDVDGRRGPNTDAAVEAYQQSKGLIVDGLVGPDTWAAMQRDLRLRGQSG